MSINYSLCPSPAPFIREVEYFNYLSKYQVGTTTHAVANSCGTSFKLWLADPLLVLRKHNVSISSRKGVKCLYMQKGVLHRIENAK